MGYTGGINHPHFFQFNVFCAHLLEQTATVTEQDMHYVNLYFVNQSGFQALLSDMRATGFHNIFIPCGCFCLPDGAFDTVGDEGKRRPPFLTNFSRAW